MSLDTQNTELDTGIAQANIEQANSVTDNTKQQNTEDEILTIPKKELGRRLGREREKVIKDVEEFDRIKNLEHQKKVDELNKQIEALKNQHKSIEPSALSVENIKEMVREEITKESLNTVLAQVRQAEQEEDLNAKKTKLAKNYHEVKAKYEDIDEVVDKNFFNVFGKDNAASIIFANAHKDNLNELLYEVSKKQPEELKKIASCVNEFEKHSRITELFLQADLNLKSQKDSKVSKDPQALTTLKGGISGGVRNTNTLEGSVIRGNMSLHDFLIAKNRERRNKKNF